MSQERQYLACPQRPGNPRVAWDVCQVCPKAKRCAAWREFNCPSLFPGQFLGLEAQRPRSLGRAARPPAIAKTSAAQQPSLPLAGL